MASSGFPPEVVQAQSKLIQLNQKHQDLKDRVNAREFEDNKSKLTLRELDSLPPERATYKRVGRMFLLTPAPALRTELTSTIEKCGRDLAALRAQDEMLAAQIKTAQKTLQELMFTHLQPS
jgi:chaperonin cofactor prefoldin